MGGAQGWVSLAALLLVAVLGVGLTAQLPAQAVVAPPPTTERSPAAQAQDAEFARMVKEWTTGSEFISPLVDHLPVVPGIPTPKDVLGYHVGAPQKLTRTRDIYGYYRALAAKSPRVKVTTSGKTAKDATSSSSTLVPKTTCVTSTVIGSTWRSSPTRASSPNSRRSTS